jgi:ribokinase
MTVVVFGSINMDLVVRTPRLPAAAETITGHEFFTAPGGKGANQAVAAARLGAPTKMVGRVGNDAFGQELKQNLAGTGVDVSTVFTDTTVSSGVAVIAVDDNAENNIIIVPGANGQIGQDDLARLEANLTEAKVLLLQLEVPLEAVVAAARLAHEQGITVVLDPAPAQELPAELYTLIDMITPNEIEAGQLIGVAVKNQDDAAGAARMLLGLGVKTVIVKMGALGVLYVQVGEEPTLVPAFEVTAVDTVAAGDAFNGGLAAALVEGQPLPVAIRWGTAAGALSATKMGAQPSMPTRSEFEAFLNQQT